EIRQVHKSESLFRQERGDGHARGVLGAVEKVPDGSGRHRRRQDQQLKFSHLESATVPPGPQIPNPKSERAFNLETSIACPLCFSEFSAWTFLDPGCWDFRSLPANGHARG